MRSHPETDWCEPAYTDEGLEAVVDTAATDALMSRIAITLATSTALKGRPDAVRRNWRVLMARHRWPNLGPDRRRRRPVARVDPADSASNPPDRRSQTRLVRRIRQFGPRRPLPGVELPPREQILALRIHQRPPENIGSTALSSKCAKPRRGSLNYERNSIPSSEYRVSG